MECPISILESKMKRQEAELEIAKRDLETIKKVYEERIRNKKEDVVIAKSSLEILKEIHKERIISEVLQEVDTSNL
jgi:hypothetical protein